MTSPATSAAAPSSRRRTTRCCGPLWPRGAPGGLVTRHGVMVARWGDTREVSQTFSVAKSYLSLLTGLAVADGLIPDIDRPVRESVDDGGFNSAQNAPITWRHLLTNTSEWEGTLFGKADSIDRGRNLGVEGQGKKGQRALAAPGTHWEYNDVRVNRLSLALLRRFGRPLPEVFRERILAPLGGSADWRWDGYRTSWVDLPDGRRVQSVPGGTPLGRRHRDPCRGPGAHRVAGAEPRRLGGPADPAGGLVRAIDRALPAQPALWLPVVAELGWRALSGGRAGCLLCQRGGRQPHLGRAVARDRRGAALDRSGRDGRLHRPGARRHRGLMRKR